MLSDFVHYQHLKPSIDGCGISVRTHARAHKAITPGLPGLRQKHPEEKTWLIKIWHYILRRWIDKILHQLVTCIMGFVFDPLVIDPSPLWHLFRLGWTIHQLVQDFVRTQWEWMHWALLAQAHFVFHHYSRPHPRSHHPQQLPPFAPAQSWTLAKWIGGLNHLKSSYYVNRPCSEPRA